MRRSRHDLFYCTAPDGARFLRWAQPPDGTLRIPAAPRHRSRRPKICESNDEADSLLVACESCPVKMPRIRRTTKLVAVVQEKPGTGMAKSQEKFRADPKRQSQKKMSWQATLTAHRVARLLSTKVPVDALPAGSLVLLADGELPSLASTGQARLHKTDDLFIVEKDLEPVGYGHEVMEESRAYLESLPRGRKAAFGATIPVCVSRLQYDQAVLVAEAAGFRLRNKSLEFELACAKAAALWNPERSKDWLFDVCERASAAGLRVSQLMGDTMGGMQPKAAEALPVLTGEGGPVPGANAAMILVEDFPKTKELIQKAIIVGSSTGAASRRVLQCQASGRLHQFSYGPHIGFCSKSHFKKWTSGIFELFMKLGGKLPQSAVKEEAVKDSLEEGEDVPVTDETSEEAVSKPQFAKLVQSNKSDHSQLRPTICGTDREITSVQTENLMVLEGNFHKFTIDALLQYIFPIVSLPPLEDVFLKAKSVIEKQEHKYQTAWDKEPEEERRTVASICFTTAQAKVIQPHSEGVHELYEEAWMRLPALYLFAVQLANLFGQQPQVEISIKPLRRALEKLLAKDPMTFAVRNLNSIVDFVRCSCTFDKLSVLAAAAEFVETELSSASSVGRRRQTLQRLGLPAEVTDLGFRFLFGKNRFSKPCDGGYRDMLLYIDIDGHICEMQMQYSGFASLVFDGQHFFRYAKIINHAQIIYIGEAHEDDKKLYGDRDNDHWLRAGFGIERYMDGSVYIGEWKNDTWGGFGTLWRANGDIYQGNWDDGEQNGFGTCWYLQGTVYQGDFVDGFQNLYGSGCTWIEDGSAEVNGKNGTIKAIFSKDRQKATLEEFEVEDDDPEPSSPKPKSEESSRGKAKMRVPCRPPEPVPVHEAVKILRLKDYPSQSPPVLAKIYLPEVFSGDIIQQGRTPGKPKYTEELKADEARRLISEVLRSPLG